MIAPPTNTQIWIAAGVTDLRRGFTGLSALVQIKLEQSPLSGQVYIFRGRRGDLIKVLWFDGDGLCLFAKRLECGRFIWPQAASGTVSLTPAQLSMLLEGIDWRRPGRSYAPQMAVWAKLFLFSRTFLFCCNKSLLDSQKWLPRITHSLISTHSITTNSRPSSSRSVHNCCRKTNSCNRATRRSNT